MDCFSESCISKATSFCDRCTPNAYFCTQHAGEHTSSIGHFPKEATSEQLQLAYSRVLRNKKAILISKVTKASSKIINEINLITQRVIKSIKRHAEDFELLTSYNEKVLNWKEIDNIILNAQIIFNPIKNNDLISIYFPFCN